MTTLNSSSETIWLGCGKSKTEAAGIYRSSFDSAKGELSKPGLAVATDNPSFLAQSKDGKLLFSVGESSGGSVSSWRMDEDDKLTLINSQPSGGSGPCHLSVTPSGRVLLVANYNSGSIAAFLIGKDGMLSSQTAFVQLTGSGQDQRRQKGPHAHGVYCAAEEKFVYCCDLGTDKLWVFKLDGEKGMLTATTPDFIDLPPGGGPRHLAFGKEQDEMYVVGEMGLNVMALARNKETGHANLLQDLPAAAAAGKGDSMAEAVTHPDGKWLIVSIRGQNTLSVFEIGEAGKLTFSETVPCGVKAPRHFSLSPDGKWLIAAGQNDNRCAVSSFDSETGGIKLTASSIEAPQPQCVLFSAKSNQPSR